MTVRPVLYFDLSDIVEHAINHSTVTGIQRSVLRIVEGLVRHSEPGAVYGVLKHPVSETFRIADLSFMAGAYDLDDFTARFELPMGKSFWIGGKLKRYRDQPAKRLVHALRFNTQWALSAKLRAEVLSKAKAAKASCLTGLTLEPGGVVVTLGAGWNTDYAALGALAASRDCKLVSFIHDMIPVQRQGDAAFSGRDKNGKFSTWIEYIAGHDALLLCNSKSTETQLQGYLDRVGLKAPSAVVKFPHEFKVSKDRKSQPLRSQVQSLIQHGRYTLCVGTIEVRKNSLGLLEAWSELAGAGETGGLTLVLAGGTGRGAFEVEEFLRKSDNAGGSVSVVAKPSDAELEQLYMNCAFTVFPSLFEGWGIPIGESLWFSKSVLCANNSSMPEVGGKYASYFDHKQPGSLRLGLKTMIDHPVELAEGIRAELTSWDDTALSVKAAIEDSLAARGAVCG